MMSSVLFIPLQLLFTDPGEPPFSEDMKPEPEDSYGIAKYAVEQELDVSQKMFGLNYIIFRPHNVYGEHQNIGDRYRNVIGIFINQALKGEPMTIFGDGEQTRAFTYISDVAAVIAHSAFMENCYNHIFNVGADLPVSVEKLAGIVADKINAKSGIIHVEERNEVTHAYADHKKCKEYFSQFINDIPLEEGVEKMVDWAKKVGARESQRFEGIEIRKNMPHSWAKDFK